MAADRAKAVREARKLLETAAVRMPPVPVERIARSLSVRVQYVPFDGDLSGMAHIKNGVPIIGVNALHHPNRQRFTIAHELGHIQLHRRLIETEVHLDQGSLRRDALAAAGIDPTEIEANSFAAELLMPEALLHAVLDGRTVDLEDDEAIGGLARKFKVSEAAMRFRLDAASNG